MEMVEDAVEITLVLKKKTIDKLQELAGSDASFSEYLTIIIQRYYTEQHIFGGTHDIEQIISLAENLAQQNRSYRTVIDNLREQYKRLAVSQEQLLATLEQLRDTTTDLLRTSKKQNIH